MATAVTCTGPAWWGGGVFWAAQLPRQHAETSSPARVVGCLPACCLPWATPLHLLLLLSLLPAKWSPGSPPKCAREGDGRLPLTPAPARLCPAPHRSGEEGDSLSPPLLWGRASLKPMSSHCCAVFLAKHCVLVPLCCSPVIFKEKLALISNYYHSKDPLHEVGLNFLHH